MRISDWSSDVCSSDLRAPATPEDLAHHNCLNFTHRTHWNTWPLTTLPRGIKAAGTLGADQGDMLMQLALHGAGIVRLAEFHIHAELAAGRLVPEIGRASCRERVGQYGNHSVVAESFKNKRYQQRS